MNNNKNNNAVNIDVKDFWDFHVNIINVTNITYRKNLVMSYNFDSSEIFQNLLIEEVHVSITLYHNFKFMEDSFNTAHCKITTFVL